MIFTALPYLVQIENDGKVVDIPVFNAEGIFKSLRLDEAKEKVNEELKSYWEFTASLNEMTEEQKNTKETFDKLTSINKKLRVATIGYLTECIKEINKFVEIIDEIKATDMQFFTSAIERAMFGQDDREAKKKISSSTTLKNSDVTAIPKKRSRNGRRSS